MSQQSVHFRDLGLIDYQKAWDLQESLMAASIDLKTHNRIHPEDQNLIPNHLLFCEHPHVYTLGKSGDIKHLLLGPEELKAQNINYYKINRGGDITYHGPGQIVGYPIFDLENFQPDIHIFLRNLEEACMLTLTEYGLKGVRYPGYTGVWMDIEGPKPRKILAIGVRSSRWITMHGFAFNVNTDLDLFKNIIPCGIDDKGVTSIQNELGMKMDMDEVKGKLLGHLGELFGFELQKA